MTQEELQWLHDRIALRLQDMGVEGRSVNPQNPLLQEYKQEVRDLCHHATQESIPILMRVVRAGTWQEKAIPALQSTAIAAAKTLMHLAEAAPSPEFVPILTSLRSGILNPWAPLEFIPIRVRLTRALKKLSGLPIPASPPASTEALPIPATSVVQELPERTEIDQACLALMTANRPLLRKKAIEAFLKIGSSAIPKLLTMVFDEPTVRDDCLRVLVLLRDSQALELLMDRIENDQRQKKRYTQQHRKLLRGLLITMGKELTTRGKREDIAALVRLVQRGASDDLFLRPAVEVARSLVQRAEREPSRELLPALEALRAGFARPSAPLEFLPLRANLSRALKHLSNLPIPASASQNQITEDLPIPSENEPL